MRIGIRLRATPARGAETGVIVLECSEIRLKYRVPTTLKLRREAIKRNSELARS